MSAEDDHARFEELDAGRALGDLDAAEAAEWRRLAERLGVPPSAQFDQIAAELEIAEFETAATPLPPELAERLKRQELPDASPPTPTPVPTPVASPAPPRGRIALFPWVGWAVAACLVVVMVLQDESTPPTEISAEERRSLLLAEAPDATQLEFSAANEQFEGVRGDVVWSDTLQEGFMSLSQLPANDPSEAQYQLWIVDPSRDELPVDGGVFDIPAGQDPAIVPIRNTLPIRDPAAFVITLEQPGGVVRSKQETVVALAKS